MPTVTFKITDTQDKLEKVYHALDRLQVRYQRDSPPSPPKSSKGKYADLARQYREEGILTGHGEEVARLKKEFREDFEL